jgi:hypothetical protein
MESRPPGRFARDLGLTANAQALNQVLVSFRVPAFQVLQETPASSHHRQQTAPRMMILFVRFEMFRQL